jgi:hypothetical protein
MNDARCESRGLRLGIQGAPTGGFSNSLSTGDGCCCALIWRSFIFAARAWITYKKRNDRLSSHTLGETFGMAEADPFKRMKSTELESTRFFDGTCSNHDDVIRLAFSVSIAFGFPYA